MRSLHGRLIVLIGTCSTVGLFVFGVIVCVVVESRLWGQFDSGMRERLLQLTQLVEQRDGKIEYEWEESGAAAIQADGERVTCWDGDHVIAVVPKSAEPLPLSAIAADRRLSPLELDGERASVISMPFVPRLDEDDTTGPVKTITLAVARPTSDVRSTIGIIRWSLVTAAGLALALTLAGVWFAVRRGLAPIHTATREIATVTPHRLDRPIANVANRASELHPLLTTINELLSRLNVAMQRERSLSSEIAHELRTPLAGLRAKLDVAVSKDRNRDDLLKIIGECSRITDQTSAIMDSLLATVVPISYGDDNLHGTDLSVICESAILNCDERFNERRLNIEHQIDDRVMVRVPEPALQIVLRNLCDNVASYADEDSTILINCKRVNGTAKVVVRNSATAFPDVAVDHIFQRLWRGDSARSNTGDHSGLGMTLTKRIVESTGGTIRANYNRPTFEIVVTWNVEAKNVG